MKLYKKNYLQNTCDDLYKSYYEEVDGSMQKTEIFTSGKTVK